MLETRGGQLRQRRACTGQGGAAAAEERRAAGGQRAAARGEEHEVVVKAGNGFGQHQGLCPVGTDIAFVAVGLVLCFCLLLLLVVVRTSSWLAVGWWLCFVCVGSRMEPGRSPKIFG